MYSVLCGASSMKQQLPGLLCIPLSLQNLLTEDAGTRQDMVFQQRDVQWKGRRKADKVEAIVLERVQSAKCGGERDASFGL